jgi:hypothetical protein
MVTIPRPRVLNVGLHPDLVTELAERRGLPTRAEEVRRGLEQTRASLDRLGVDFDSYLVAGGVDVAEGLRVALMRCRYDFAVIGGGVRLDPEMTHLLEVLVNTIVAVSPSTVLCFNTGPSTTVDAIRRWWPTDAPLQSI